MSRRNRPPTYGTPRTPQAPIPQQAGRVFAPRDRAPIENDNPTVLLEAAKRAPPSDADALAAIAAAELDAVLDPEPDVCREALMLLRNGNGYSIVGIPYVEGVTPIRVIDDIKSASGLVAVARMTREFQRRIGEMGLLRAARPGDTGIPFLPEAEASDVTGPEADPEETPANP